MSGFGRKELKEWIYGVKASEHAQILKECGCDDPDNAPLYDDNDPYPEDAPRRGTLSQDGTWTPDQLYQHFDEDGDGTVSMGDYADHIAHHQAHPELTQPYETMKSNSMDNARCPDSYSKSGDMMIQIPHEIVDLLKPLMQKIGVGCPASTARAMADVLDVAMDQEVVQPFSTDQGY